MTAIPLFFQLRSQNILIVGGGRSALIKLRTMLSFTKHIVMVAPEFREEIIRLSDENSIKLRQGEFCKEDLMGAGLVFAAAVKEVNDLVHEEAKKVGVLCCKAEGGGDFILPACKKQGELTVAISTNGRFPMIAKKLCREMDLSISHKLTELSLCRRWILQNWRSKEEARVLLEQIADCADKPLELAEFLGRIGYENH